MSLFGTITNASTALQASQLGLQTVGHNIANADTKGFIRQKLQQTTPTPFRQGNIIMGNGVRPTGVTQEIDKALVERMWSAGSDVAAARLRERVLADVEALLNDLNGGGLSKHLDAFNIALHDWSVEPNDPSLRRFVMLAADSMTREINNAYVEARNYQTELDSNVKDTLGEINILTDKISDLNLQITTIEGGRTVASDATGLRDERYRAIERLSELVKINVQEQSSGSVSIFIGGDYLVAETHSRELYLGYGSEKNAGKVLFTDNDAQVDIRGGELKSMTESRDVLLGGVLGGLDQMASDMIRQFNTTHSQGQADQGFTNLTGEVTLNPTAPLQESGILWEIEGGTFEVALVDDQGEHISRHQIAVRTTGEPSQISSVQTIVDDIDAIDGISATVLPNGQLQIDSDIPGVRFTFANDSSEFLAAAGVNLFFRGNNAETIAVSDLLRESPQLMAISKNGVGNDTETLSRMVDLIDEKMDRRGGDSIRDQYTGIITQLAQTAANQKSELEGLSQYYATLNAEHLAITGVNIDEEALRMMGYQRTFQASSRVIAAANEMLEILTNL